MKENRIETDQTLSDIPSAEPERPVLFYRESKKTSGGNEKRGRPASYFLCYYLRLSDECQRFGKTYRYSEKIGYVEEPEEEKAIL